MNAETEKAPKPAKKTASAKELKRKKVVKRIMEKGGKSISVSAAMRDAGYSSAYAKNPQEFLGTKTTQDLLEQYFPDDYLHAKHKELIEASELDSFLFPALNTGKKNKKAEQLTNDEIRYIVEEIGRCTLVYIRDSKFPDGRIAFFRLPAWKARKDGLEMAYKLKGKFIADKEQQPVNPFAGMSDAELAGAIKEAKDVLTKRK